MRTGIGGWLWIRAKAVRPLGRLPAGSSRTTTERRNSGLGRGFGGLDLGQEDVADVVPVGDEGQRGMRVLVGGVHARGGAIQGGPRETHEQLRLSPRRLEGIGDGALELARPISA